MNSIKNVAFSNTSRSEIINQRNKEFIPPILFVLCLYHWNYLFHPIFLHYKEGINDIEHLIYFDYFHYSQRGCWFARIQPSSSGILRQARGSSRSVRGTVPLSDLSERTSSAARATEPYNRTNSVFFIPWLSPTFEGIFLSLYFGLYRGPSLGRHVISPYTQPQTTSPLSLRISDQFIRQSDSGHTNIMAWSKALTWRGL